MLIAICADGSVGERRQGFSEGRDVVFSTVSLTLWCLQEWQQSITSLLMMMIVKSRALIVSNSRFQAPSPHHLNPPLVSFWPPDWVLDFSSAVINNWSRLYWIIWTRIDNNRTYTIQYTQISQVSKHTYIDIRLKD